MKKKKNNHTHFPYLDLTTTKGAAAREHEGAGHQGQEQSALGDKEHDFVSFVLCVCVYLLIGWLGGCF